MSFFKYCAVVGKAVYTPLAFVGEGATVYDFPVTKALAGTFEG
jgi:hypothetical protein